MRSAGRGSTSPGLELPSVRLADPDRAVLRAGLVGPDRARLPLAVGAGAAVYVDVPLAGRLPRHSIGRPVFQGPFPSQPFALHSCSTRTPSSPTLVASCRRPAPAKWLDRLMREVAR